MKNFRRILFFITLVTLLLSFSVSQTIGNSISKTKSAQEVIEKYYSTYFYFCRLYIPPQAEAEFEIPNVGLLKHIYFKTKSTSEQVEITSFSGETIYIDELIKGYCLALPGSIKINGAEFSCFALYMSYSRV
jgi:hypothetical protein